jgi:succinyl-CoA synthetase alpha subunit
MEKLKPDATGIYVAAHQAPAAIEEAIEAEVPLIVAVAEHIPIHDIMRVLYSHLVPKFILGSGNQNKERANSLRYIQC